MSKHENGKKHVLGRILGAAVLGAGAVAAVRTVRAIVSAKADEAVRTYGEPECAPENGCEESDSCAPCGCTAKAPCGCTAKAPCGEEEAASTEAPAEEAPGAGAAEGDDEEA